MKYRYFLRQFKTFKEIYRCPQNGKSFIANIAYVEKFDNNEWTNESNKIIPIRNEGVTGWFDDDNEIPEAEAFKIMNELVN